MSLAMILYLGGMAAIYVGERLLGPDHTARWLLLGIGGIAVVGSIAMRAQARSRSDDDGVRYGNTVALGLSAAGLMAVMLYGLSTDGFVDMIGFEDATAERWYGVFGAIWPIGWLAATVPLLVTDVAISDSPVVLPRRRVTMSALNALAAVLAVSILFPLNYISSNNEEQWDFSYFKTAEPSQGTKELAAGLERQVTVRVFLPTSSDVLPEVTSYFDQLDSDKIEIVVIDQAAEPELARELRVRDNGFMAFTVGALEDAESQDEKAEEGADDEFRSHVVDLGGEELDTARAELRKLDEKVQKALLSMIRGKLTVYVTTGHDELHWDRDRKPINRIDGLKQILEFMNFRVKTLGIGDGLAEEVPDDADVVMVLAPMQPLLPAEGEALRKYLERGGAIFVAAEPEMVRGARIANADDGLADLLRFIGYEVGEGVLASESSIVPMARNKTDKLNITTDRFSVHASTNVLADRSARLQLFLPTSGWLDDVKGAKSKRTVTVRSRNETWADLNRNLELDKDAGEKKESRPIAAVAVGTQDPPWRALVVADGSLLSDVPIQNPGNQQFVYDGLNWLTGEQGVTSAPESEEDVKIQHTREGQGIWFYGTILGMPLLVLAFGLLRVRRRRKLSEATEKDRAEPIRSDDNPRPKRREMDSAARPVAVTETTEESTDDGDPGSDGDKENGGEDA